MRDLRNVGLPHGRGAPVSARPEPPRPECATCAKSRSRAGACGDVPALRTHKDARDNPEVGDRYEHPVGVTLTMTPVGVHVRADWNPVTAVWDRRSWFSWPNAGGVWVPARCARYYPRTGL